MTLDVPRVRSRVLATAPLVVWLLFPAFASLLLVGCFGNPDSFTPVEKKPKWLVPDFESTEMVVYEIEQTDGSSKYVVVSKSIRPVAISH